MGILIHAYDQLEGWAALDSADDQRELVCGRNNHLFGKKKKKKKNSNKQKKDTGKLTGISHCLMMCTTASWPSVSYRATVTIE